MGADWDAKLPLNIEDEDIYEGMAEPPNERKGLTSLSYCLFTFWVLDQQRNFFHANKGRFALSWQSNKSLPDSSKDTLIEQLENGINKNFLQYCDPIKPIDTLIQLLARALICGMRMRTLLTPAQSGKTGHVSEEHRSTLLNASMQLLEYNVAMHSHPSLRSFQWLVTGFFPWQAFMCVLVEMSHGKDSSKAQRIWDLLSDLYTANASLSELLEDRRRLHAARLVVTAWKACLNNPDTDRSLPNPDFVANLEARLSEVSTGLAPNIKAKDTPHETVGQSLDPMIPEGFMAEQDFSAAFDFDFPDIDWSFWNSID
ncbi:MAG: hypothetical protein OHK93_000804 [Ramalina farinacea]|uniref:Uncharacterized protein n=1 Tax=Ramalina farinacea TaxID=258253 RepID=A0AA43QPA7_9LECA|nr:hypothetical protein [Ramalina farinacea]